MNSIHPRLRACALAAAFASTVLAGCASAPVADEAKLTYETSPDGAHLYEGSLDLGVAPVTRTYRLDPAARAAAAPGTVPRITTPDVTAVWPSGAKTGFFTILDVGADRVATLLRPSDAAGREADEAHGREVAALRKAEDKRLRDETMRDEARASARCKAQNAGQGAPGSDDCR